MVIVVRYVARAQKGSLLYGELLPRGVNKVRERMGAVMSNLTLSCGRSVVYAAVSCNAFLPCIYKTVPARYMPFIVPMLHSVTTHTHTPPRPH